ncbi:hypothetical protein [Sphingopyxis sp.]|uniref:hypothetical protein n=1 Tax=Sphingopyxis sp. TaxID=1908224 RepID=UPI003D0DD62E
MGKGSYLGGSTVGRGDVKKAAGKSSRFSSKMMEAYKLRTMTATERKAYQRRKRQNEQALATSLEASKPVVITKLDVRLLPMLKPGDVLPASELKSMTRLAKARSSLAGIKKKS